MKKFTLTQLFLFIVFSAFSQTTYNYTGAVQSYTVPAGVTRLLVDMQGGKGGNSSIAASGGSGGRIQAVLTVVPGQVLNVFVGGAGNNYNPTYSLAVATGGSMTGGVGGYYSGGGGGASDIRIGGTTLTNRVLVAGGGGGAGYNCGTINEGGGYGGGLIAATGYSCGSISTCNAGSGGSQIAGGAGASCYITDSGTLGNGGQAYATGTLVGYGGGGGGGYYGGGGGAFGGGGGGSSFAAASFASFVINTPGFNSTGNGIVSITPLAGCTGTVTAGTAVIAPSVGGAGTSFALNISGSTLASGLTYQWQSSHDSATWTNISGATNPNYTFTGITANTYFHCIVSCGASSSSSISGGVLASYTLVPSCLPTVTSWYSESGNVSHGASSFNIVGLSGSTLNDVGITSSADATTGYINHTALPAIQLQQGGNYASTVTWGTVTSHQFTQVWIDFNDDGVFQTSEEVSPVSGYSASTTIQPTTFNISIPFTANIGSHLMRMRGIEETVSTDIGSAPAHCDPCLIKYGGVNPTYWSGDVVDYTVLIVTLPACTGTPVAGATTSSATVVCPSNTFSLNITGTLSAGQTYQWQSSADSITWNNISGATSISYSTSQSSATYYRCMVTCTTTSLSSTSLPIKINELSVCPCVPAFGNSCTSFGTYTGISSLVGELGTSITDASTCSPSTSNSYYDEYPLTSVALMAGNTYSPTIKGGAYYFSSSAQVWIDFNDNGLFESSESVGGISYPFSSFTQTATLTIPSSATLGVHRMRIVSNYNCCGASTYPSINPCPSSSVLYGDAKDYKVTIIPPPPTVVPLPTSISFGAVTTGTSSPVVFFTINGSYLIPSSGSITITAPSFFQVSSDGITWVTSYSFPYLGATIPPANVYVRFNPTSSITYSGNIQITGGGLGVPVNVPVSGVGALACTGTPVAGTSGIFPSIGSGITPFTLSLTGASVSGGLSFQWQSASSGSGPWTNIPGATNSTNNFTGISARTFFKCIVSCPSYAVAVSSITSATYIPAPACNPTAASWYSESGSYNYGAKEFLVSGFGSTSINDTGILSAINTSNGYLNRSASVPPVSFEQNGLYATSIVWGIASYYQFAQVWIDFNDDGTFQSSEEVTPVVGYNSIATAQPTNFNIRIPLTANTGVHLMRIRAVNEQLSTDIGSAPAHLDPCLLNYASVNPNYYSGDVIDYQVNIVALPACTGMPNAGSAVASVNLACPSSSFSLSTTGTAALGLTYQWQSSPDSITWTNISGATSIPYSTTETAATYYRCSATCVTSGLTAISGGVKENYISGCFCTPSYFYGSPAASNALSNFSLIGYSSSVINDNGPSVLPSNGYEDRTNIAINLQQNGTYSGSITYNTNWQEYEDQVWIDFNDNGTFELSEEVTGDFGVTGCIASGISASYTMTIPLMAPVGMHRMRVRQAETYSCSVEPHMDPCNLVSSYSGDYYYYGCTRDYTANIIPLPPCTGTPSAGVVSATDTTDCNLYTSILTVTGATAASGLSYQWQSSMDGVTWSNIGGATNVTYSAFVSVGIYYRFTVTCTSPGLTSVSAPIHLSITTFPGPLTCSTGGSPAGPFAICNTATGVSFSGAVGGGVWNSSSSVPGTINPSTGAWTSSGTVGTSTISYSIGACTAIATLHVNNTSPSAPILVSGTNPICAYSTLVLSDTTFGGVWSTVDTAIASVDVSGNVTGKGNGMATITYNNGCGAGTYPITVNGSAITVTPANGSICNGSNLNLSATYITGTGVSYSWSGPGGSSATSSLSVNSISPSGAGTYTFTTTTSPSTGSCVEVLTLPILVSPVPSVIVTQSASTVCLGNSTSVVTGHILVPAYTTLLSQNFNTGLTGQVGGVWSIVDLSGDISSYWSVRPSPGYSSIVTGDGSDYMEAAPNAYISNTNTQFVSPPFSTVGYSNALLTFNYYISESDLTDGTAEIDYSVDGGSSWNLLYNYISTGITGATTWVAGSPNQGISLPTDAMGYSNVKLRWNYSSNNGLYWAVDNIEVTGVPTVYYGWSGLSGATGLSCTVCGNTTITPTVPGMNVYNLVVTAGACSTTTNDTVNVNPLPSIISGPSSVCIGGTGTFTNSVSGGTWSSSATSVATVNPATGVLSGLSTGVVTLTYTLASTGCYVTTSVNVTTILPSAINGVLSVCSGGTTTLSDSTVGGIWNSLNPGIATINSSTGILTGIAAGTVTIDYATVCGPTTAVVTVNTISPSSILGTVSICAGSTTTLSDLVSGGTWSSGSDSIATISSTTGIVHSISGGTSIITYSTGCGANATAILTVNASPAAITGPSIVCTGGTATLANTSTGGTWTTSSISVANIAGSTGVVTGIANGTAIITYANGCGAVSITVITVNGTPAPISGVTTLCNGSTTTLYDISAEGIWTSSAPLTAAVGGITGVVTGFNSGTAIITYTTNCGSTSIPVTVNGTPSGISGSIVTCTGGTTTLSDATVGGTWSSSAIGTAVIGSTSGVVLGISTGSTTITYTSACGYTTTPLSVNGLPASITGSSTVCAGGSTTLSDPSAGGTWSSMTTGIASVGSSTGIVTGFAAGTDTIIYTTACGSTSKTITVNAVTASITGSSSVCTGGSITLSNSTTGGTWSSSSTGVASVGSATGIVSGVSAGTATITYTGSCGIVTKSVTVNSIAPVAITGSTTLCSGANTTLADATAGGTWSIASTAIATVSSSGVVSGLSGGTTLVSYSTGCGSPSTVAISVNPAPSAISGSSSVCVGGTITLSDSVSGGTWTSGATVLATVGASTGIVTGVVTGTVNITYSNSCGSAHTSVTVNFGVPSAVTGASSLCIGNSATLTDAVTGGTWSSNLPSVASVGAASGIVTGGSAGTAIISYSTGCGSLVTKSITINALPLAISGPSSVCQSGSITLSDVFVGGTWSSSATGIATVAATTGIVTGITSGVATITYSVTGCNNVIKTITVNGAPSAIAVGSGSVCVGGTAIVTDATSGGTWSSGATSIATIDPTLGVVTGVASGVVPITYTYSCGTTSTTITVNGVPATITGSNNICISSLVTLNDATVGGTWSSNATGIATIDASSGLLAGVSGGTTLITYSTICGYTTMPITVNSSIAISGSHLLCAGNTTTLSDVASGGTWSSGSTSVATVNSSTGVVSGIAAGTTNIIYNSGTSCGSSAFVVTVNSAPASITGVNTICAGSSTTLSDITTGGSWTSSLTGIATVDVVNGVVNGLIPGTTTITYSNGCLTPATISLTVNGVPSAISGSLTTCIGSTTTLADITSGGSWSISPVTVATIGSSSGIVTGVAAGNATITYSNGCGSSAFAIVTVNGAPLPIIGVPNICQGATTTFADPSSGGTWSSNLGTVATIGGISGVVVGVAPGTAIISYTTVCGVSTSSLNVNTSPSVITGGNSVCAGSTLTLSDAFVGGTWSSGASANASVNASGVVTGINSGTASITYSNGCGTNATKTISINSLPSNISGPNTVCTGSNITLTDSTTGGKWKSATTSIATIDSVTGNLHGVSVGADEITYTVHATGCFKAVSINVPPATSLLSHTLLGQDTICIWSNITLIDSVIGLLSSSSWYSSNPSIASVSASGVVTGNVIGSTIIHYIVTGCGSDSASLTVDVRSIPDSVNIIGASTVCAGATTTLTSSAPGGTWSSSNDSISTVTDGLVTGISVGTDLIRYSVTNSCGTSTFYKPFTVLGVADSITGTFTVCVGATTSLFDLTTGGTWRSYNTGTALVDSISGVVVGINGGADTIQYTTGCGLPALAIITVNILPDAGIISGPGTVCGGANIVLTDPSTGGFWTTSDSTVAIVSSSGVVTGVHAGIDTIVYTVALSCGTQSATMPITVHPSPIAGLIVGSDSVCLGTVTTLTSTSTGGTWRISNNNVTDIAGVITGTSAGMDTIFYTVNTTYCGSDSTSKVITIVPLPNAGAISGLSSICVGSNLTLTDAVSGGWWTIDSTTIASVSGGSVHGVSAGTATITYSVTNYCSFDTATTTHTVTINPLPHAGTLSGLSSLCIGQYDTLSSSSSGGTWSVMNGDATISPSGIVTAVSQGIDTVRYIVSTLSCGADTATMLLIINPPAMAGLITGSNSMCIGASTTLADTIIGGVWRSANNTIATIGASTGVLTGVAHGVDSVYYTIVTTCGTDSTWLVIHIDTILKPSILARSFVCINGKKDTLAGIPAGGVWSVSNANATLSADTLTGAVKGYDTLSYSVTNSCGTKEKSVSILIYSKGECDSLNGVNAIQPNGDEFIKVYPNPTAGSFIVEIPKLGVNTSIMVMDIYGKVIERREIVDNTSLTIPFNINNLASGTYLIRVISDGVIFNGKVLVVTTK